ncbi:hypothetical protein JYU34_005516 [Plutella xylostella]|uniref:Uncharacterized protein n=1 Tax=Plutella xylostella TaxID=51655 RepID=A0ABQ7QTE3_PLUXY|nr:hypothetical protein JYU34_005516 [Plutella xylostella]
MFKWVQPAVKIDSYEGGLKIGEMWQWMEGGGAAPCARGKHAACVLGGAMYVLGGRGAGGNLPLRDFWRYHLASGVWERLDGGPAAPPALQEHSATSHEASLYVFGGEVGALATETPLWVYNTETRLWRKLPGSPAPVQRRGRRAGGGKPAGGGPRGRRGHSAHALKDCLLVYGGYMDLKGSTNELWAFHYESESWHQVRTAGPGPARHRHAAALHDNKLYVHGGQCDLRECADLWHYDTMSRVWSQVRTPAKLSPGPRSGHAALRAGAHLYIFGGESAAVPTNELWRFHFATESWERIHQNLSWPSARVDCRLLLVPGAAPGPRGRAGGPGAVAPRPARPDPPSSLLREISKLSSFHMRRNNRASYSVLDQDSTESLHAPPPPLPKSLSAYVIDKRQPGDGSERGAGGGGGGGRGELARERISVPDFADMVLPAPALSPAAAAKLVYLDSDEEEDMKRELREMELLKRQEGRLNEFTKVERVIVAIPKSASVRFTKEPTVVTAEDESELSTSDYASAERVNRLSGTSSLGFCNPHYLGGDVRRLGAALTPDSGVAGDIELQDLSERGRAGGAGGGGALALLLVGGREPAHPALLQRPLSMWTYRLL